jgi:hypothetical protein
VAGRPGLFLSLVGFALGALVYFPLQNPALQLWVAVLLGLGWARPPLPAAPPAVGLNS